MRGVAAAGPKSGISSDMHLTVPVARESFEVELEDARRQIVELRVTP